MNWIHTRTGVRFDLDAPTPGMVNILDIAHALAAIPRFCGHTFVPYSVAQHSVYVSQAVPPGHALWGLLHDAAEAYTHDLSRPLKQAMRAVTSRVAMSDYDMIAARVMAAICLKFNLNRTEPVQVKDADNTLLCTERRDLFGDALTEDWHHIPANGFKVLEEVIVPWCFRSAKEAFLERFFELGGKL